MQEKRRVGCQQRKKSSDKMGLEVRKTQLWQLILSNIVQGRPNHKTNAKFYTAKTKNYAFKIKILFKSVKTPSQILQLPKQEKKCPE